MQDEIINKVAQSSLITIDLEEWRDNTPTMIYDLKNNLFQELILKEKDFREFLKNHDWSIYKDKNIAIICSADAIVPTWAYMLLAVHLESVANYFVFGTLEDLEKSIFQNKLQNIDLEQFKDKKIVIKGCGSVPIPTYAYVELTRLLRPHVASLMFGEPCSTVPLYKKVIQKY